MLGAAVAAAVVVALSLGAPGSTKLHESIAGDVIKPEPVTGQAVALKTSGNLSATLAQGVTPAVGQFVVPLSCSALVGTKVYMMPSAGKSSFVGGLNYPAPPPESLWSAPRDVPRGLYVDDVARSCLVNVRTDIGPAEGADGKLLFEAVDGSISTLGYSVQRTLALSVYVGLMLCATMMAAITVYLAAVIKWGLRSEEVCETYKLSDGWATTATAIGAAGGAILSASGVLNEYLPQYETGGFLGANIVVGILLALAPAAFLAMRTNVSSNDPQFFATARTGCFATKRGLYVASCVALTAIYGQILLVAIVMLAMGVEGWLALLVLLVLVLAWYTVKSFSAARASVLEENTKGLL